MNKLLSLGEAERTFKAYGCTHFHMAREEPEFYSRYKDLNISKECELEWTQECFNELIEQLISNTGVAGELWWKHSQAVTYSEYIQKIETLKLLYEVSLKIINLIPSKDTIKCAESILDRRQVSAKRGPIFLSLELGDKRLAKHFLDLAVKLIAKYDNSEPKRKAETENRAKLIMSELAK